MHTHGPEKEKQPGKAPGAALARDRAYTASAVPGALDPAGVLALQRLIGNRAVEHMLAQDQHVHGAGDHDDPAVQRDLVEAALRSPAKPIEPSRRTSLEAYHGTSFAGVRLHTGPVARRSAEALDAVAYTVGKDIVSATDHIDDETLGHETKHVEQQSRGKVSGTDNGAGLPVSHPDDRFEREATAEGAAFAGGAHHAPSLAAQRVVQGGTVTWSGNGPLSVQRMGKEKKSASQIIEEIHKKVKKRWDVYGGGRLGMGPAEVRMRFARPMGHEETMQTLSHNDFLLYDAMQGIREQTGRKKKKGDKSEVDDREVQGMLINNRLFFASNFNDSIDLLSGYESDNGLTDSYRSLLGVHESDTGRSGGLSALDAGEYVGRLRRADEKMQMVFDGERGTSADATAAALRKRFGKPVKIVEADDPHMRTWLTDSDHEGAIFLVRFDKERDLMHAELKLLLLLHRSGLKPEEVTSAHAIAGRYRGCLGCTAAMMYYRDVRKFNSLTINPNFGFYYKESLDNLAKHLKHVVEDSRFEEIIMGLLDQLPSTPARSRQQPPPPPDSYENNGPETTDSAAKTARRNYRSPSSSDVETTVDTYGQPIRFSKPRSLDEGYTRGYERGAKGSTVGPGMPAKTVIRPHGPRIIKAEHWKEIQETWSGNDEEAKKRTFSYWKHGYGAQQAELASIIKQVEQERTLKAIDSALDRYTRKEGEDNLADTAKETIKHVIRKYPDNPFCRAWEKVHKKGAPGNPDHKEMPDELAMTLAQLQEDGYSAASMSRYLHTGDDGGKIRKVIARRGKALLEKYGAPTEEMEGLQIGHGSYAQPAAGTSASAGQLFPEIAGYKKIYDSGTGQTYYVNQVTGERRYLDHESNALLPFPEDMDVDAGAGQQQQHQSVQEGDDGYEYEYTESGKGKGRAAKRRKKR